MARQVKRNKGERFEPIGIEIPNANNVELYYGDTNFISAFDFLQGHLKIEMACHGEGILKHYFKMTGYEWLPVPASGGEYEGFSNLAVCDCPWNYDDIDTIDTSQKEIFYNKMISNDKRFTQQEQLQLDRHFNDGNIYGAGQEQDAIRRWLWSNPTARKALIHKYKPDKENELHCIWTIISDKYDDNIPFTDEDKIKVANHMYFEDLDTTTSDQSKSNYQKQLLKLKDNTLYKRMKKTIYGREVNDTDFWEALEKIETGYRKYYMNPLETVAFIDDD
jgi:hypothetical protein